MTTTEKPLSLADFTVTVDVEHSSGDRIVVWLDRDGEDRLCAQMQINQLLWMIDDPDMFRQAFAQRHLWADPYATPKDAPQFHPERVAVSRVPWWRRMFSTGRRSSSTAVGA